MQAVGVLLCGYGPKDAQAIKVFLDRTLDTDVILMGALLKTETTVGDLLEQGPQDCFAEEEGKILMFLGFSEAQVRRVLQDFPSGDGGVRRPIFCSLTEQNRNWPLRDLVEHLAEEHRRWSAR